MNCGWSLGGQDQGSNQYYTIVPDSDGYSLYLQDWSSGQPTNEKLQSFPTEQEAHEFAAKDPSLDGVPFLENGSAPSKSMTARPMEAAQGDVQQSPQPAPMPMM